MKSEGNWLQRRSTKTSIAIGFSLLLPSCGDPLSSVIVYVSVDRQVAEPVLDEFGRLSGQEVRAAYDTEANKTIGLVNRLIAEKSAPRADVFWSAEILRTEELCRRGILITERPTAPKKPSVWDDPKGCWKAFSGRFRVLLRNRNHSDLSAEGLADFTKSQWRGRACLANPRFGSTGSHFSGLLVRWGEPRFRDWLRSLIHNEVAMLPGNAQVREAVSQGNCWLGLTDTDDALEALVENAPVEIVVPDQSAGSDGAFLVLSSVALVAGGPHRNGASMLRSYLVSPDVERRLATSVGGFFPVRHALESNHTLPEFRSIRIESVSVAQLADAYPRMLLILEQEWPR